MHIFKSIIFFLLLFTISISAQNMPHLKQQETATQLIVEGKPYLILGGELGNSTASDLKYLEPFWENFGKLNVNTILAPVYWELMEPEEGTFDFSLVDGLILQARKHNTKLVLLWFGIWKNSMSSYVPAWVKTDLERFPRSLDKNRRGKEILSPFNANNLEYDKKAFSGLMKHLKEIDSDEQTVIMVQVENEVGMIPEPRDYSDAANELFKAEVPEGLISYMNNNKERLTPELKEIWGRAGNKILGSWEQVFGTSVATEELFMAWYYSKFLNELAAAGKAEYPLPMFVNAALIREGYKPGQYPSAGPLPHLMDIWKAAGDAIDFLSPDIYFPNFSYWSKKYKREDNPLFIPEAEGSHQSASNGIYAIGRFDAIGFSPFSIESLDPENHRLAKCYSVLKQLTPLILENQGKGKIAGVLLNKDTPSEKINLGNYNFNFSFELNDRYAAKPSEEDPRAGGIIIQIAEDEFIVAGSGLIVTFESLDSSMPIAGIISIDEGKYEDGRWIAGRRLNGDQNHQGRHMRLSYSNFEIQKVKLYKYK